MDKLISAIIAIAWGILIVFLLASVQGTILWIIYPHIHALFSTPTILANSLSWWDSVCISWIAQILIKSNNHFSKTK